MEQQPTPELRSLTNPPNDGITALTYIHSSSSSSNSSNLLASTSWDGCLRIHDTSSLEPQIVSSVAPQVPLLCLALKKSHSNQSSNNSGLLYVGGLDGTVRSLDVSSSVWSTIGSHSKNGCSAVVEAGNGMVVSAGWDSTVRCWDVRSGATNGDHVLNLPGKAFSMDAVGNTIVVATSGRRLCIYDCRQMGQPISLIQERESSLKYQMRTVRLFPDGIGMAIGSIEGRVAIEYVDEHVASTLGRKKYAFKCHRIGETIYPVNSIAFHPTFGTFATGGCDGSVIVWDGLNKKRISSLPKFPTSIAAMAFNFDGTELAIASSYTFEEGERDHPRDEVFVRKMLESECKPKQK